MIGKLEIGPVPEVTITGVVGPIPAGIRVSISLDTSTSAC